MIKTKNLTKKYVDSAILRDINLDISRGQLTTLLGQNGAGKSTLLRIIAGQEFPTSGVVNFQDNNIHQLSFNSGNEMIFINELIEIYFNKSAEEYSIALSENYPNYDHQIFLSMMNDCQIDITKNFQEFSRGQRMQYLLAHALACKPKILLLDEITSVIDVYARKYFLDALRSYCDDGGSVLITTNIISELEFYTDHLIILKNENIVLSGSGNEVMGQFLKLRKTNKNEDHPIFKHNKCVWSNTNSDRSQSFIIPKSEIGQEIPKELLDRRQSTLEDIFIYYFNGLEKKAKNENAA
jgi:ABC-2 type transport system ATP-binding protein